MFSEVQDQSEELLAAAEDILNENPHAVSTVLDDEEEDESAPFAMPSSQSTMNNNNTSTSASTLNPTISNSLLERIQQQKNASAAGAGGGGASMTSSVLSGAGNEAPPSSSSPPPSTLEDSEFGYPPVSENYTYATGPTTNSTTPGVHIPNYASARGPNPYDTTGHTTTPQEKFQTILSAAASLATRAYRGTQSVVSGMMGAPSSTTERNAVSGGGERMPHQMDYQRESLLMDPHELEESGMMASSGTGGGGISGFFGMASSYSNTESNGLMGTSSSGGGGNGLESTMSSSSQENTGWGYTILGYLKTFCLDMKDLFLSSPRHIQFLVIGLVWLILWLLFSEI